MLTGRWLTRSHARTRTQVYGEGTHLCLPWFDKPVVYNVRATPNQVQSTSGGYPPM